MFDRIERNRPRQLRNFMSAVGTSAPVASSKRGAFRASAKRAIVNAYFLQKAYDERSRVAYVAFWTPMPILHGLDVIPVNLEINSALFAFAKNVGRFRDAAEARHFSRDVCTSARCAMGIVFEDCLPSPDLILVASYPCDSFTRTAYLMKVLHGVPCYLIDVPYHRNEESIAFLADYLRHVAREIERDLGLRLDEAKMKKAIENENRSMAAFKGLLESSRQRPARALSEELLELALSTYWSTDEFAAAIDLLVAEVAAQGAKPPRNGRARKRILWSPLLPQYSVDLVRYLDEECDIDVYFASALLGTWEPIDPEDPFRGMAEKMLSFYGIGGVRKWLEENRVLEKLESYQIAGGIALNNWGCRHFTSVNQVLRDVLRKQGIPMLEIDADFLDDENFAFSQIKTRLDAFVDLVHGGAR